MRVLVLVVVVLVVLVVTGGKQSQLPVRLTWTRPLDLDWSLTLKKIVFRKNEKNVGSRKFLLVTKNLWTQNSFIQKYLI